MVTAAEVTPDQVIFMTNYLRAKYPDYAAYMQVPEVAAAITAAYLSSGGQDPGALAAAVTSQVWQTNWYQTTPDQTRNFIMFQAQDPASAELQVTQKADQFRLQLQAWGVPYDANQLRDFARFALSTGASDPVMLQEMVSHFSKGFNSADLPGTIGTSQRTIEGMGRQYAVNLTEDQTRWMATSLLTGQTSEANIQDFISDQAKSMYPYLAGYIDQGISPAQYAAPYINAAAGLTEINPVSIDLTDPKWGRVLQPYNDAPLTLYDWQRVLRTDPQYGYDKTTQAREASASFATNLLRMFGGIG